MTEYDSVINRYFIIILSRKKRINIILFISVIGTDYSNFLITLKILMFHRLKNIKIVGTVDETMDENSGLLFSEDNI